MLKHTEMQEIILVMACMEKGIMIMFEMHM